MASSRVQIAITADGLEASVRISTGPASDTRELYEALHEGRVICGIDDDVCRELGRSLADPNFEVQNHVIAAGVPPVAGDDARWIPNFDLHIQPGTTRQDGTFDTRQRQLFHPVKVGDVLAEKQPATPGHDGTAVTGAAIPARPGCDLSPDLGKGTAEDAEGRIVALRDGVIKYVPDQTFDVVDYVVHSRDVDLRSGDVETGGSVKIEGSVMPGMAVRAGGDVEVTRDIDGGTVVSEGNAIVGGDLISRDSAVLSAKGSGTLRRIQGSTVQCGHLLIVHKDSVNSDVSASEAQVAGRIVGGIMRVEKHLEVREAGSTHGTQTVLSAAEPLIWPVEVARAAHREAAVRRSSQYRADRSASSADRVKSGKAARETRTLEEEAILRQAELRRRRAILLDIATIDVGLVHPGTTVRFGMHEQQLETTQTSVRFRYSVESGEILTERLPW